MRHTAISLFTSLTKEELTAITNIVNETVAAGQTAPKEKVFSSADLWNIQRQKKSFGTRRFL